MQTEYKTLYGILNPVTGCLALTYWASSQKHKALFSTRQKAEDALRWFKEKVVVVEIQAATIAKENV